MDKHVDRIEQAAIASLRTYPGNPRRGNVEAIKQSLEQNGQYRPIVVNRCTTEVLAGNHTLRAARELGWEQIAVTYVDVDEARPHLGLVAWRAAADGPRCAGAAAAMTDDDALGMWSAAWGLGHGTQIALVAADWKS